YPVVTSGVAVGLDRLTDRRHRIASPVPASVAGDVFIRTAGDDKNAYPGSSNFLSFDVNVPVRVYVAHDNRMPRPYWLMSGWTDTGQDLWDSDRAMRGLRLFSRDYAA